MPRARLRDRFDRIDDRLVAGAAAVIAGEMLADCVAARAPALASASSCAVSSMPGVQKPHCSALRCDERLPAGRRSRRCRTRPRWSRPRAVALHREHQAAAHDHRRRRAPCRRRRRRARSRHGCRSAPGPRAGNRPASCAHRRARLRVRRSPSSGNVVCQPAHACFSISCGATGAASTPARCNFTAAEACRSSSGSRSRAQSSNRLLELAGRECVFGTARAQRCRCQRRKRQAAHRRGGGHLPARSLPVRPARNRRDDAQIPQSRRVCLHLRPGCGCREYVPRGQRGLEQGS